jgi:putative endonuclease
MKSHKRTRQDDTTKREITQVTTTKIGTMGEDIVAQWLKNQGWEILETRWRCRGGEIDIIALNHNSPLLSFIEVKTRSQNNWDRDGILAINTKKQEKLWQSAEIYLSDRASLAEYPCRFDVALVRYQKGNMKLQPLSPQMIALAQPIWVNGYILTITDYIESAFIT